MSPIKSMIAVLFALGSAGALAQGQAPAQAQTQTQTRAAQQPPTGKPVDDSATFGPVLNPQPTPATTQQPTPASTQAAGEARPQAQEERAGQVPPTNKHNEVDPSARPAPESTQPQGRAQDQQGQQQRQQQAGKPKQAQRRAVEQRIESTPRIAAPAPVRPARATSPAVSAPVGPQSTQAVGCIGSTCTGVDGGTYNATGPGNTAVSSSGRPCTRNGANIQCL